MRTVVGATAANLIDRATLMGRRDDNLQLKLQGILAPIFAVTFVLAKEGASWFTAVLVGLVVGFLVSGAIVWFWVDVLKRSSAASSPPFSENADVPRLEKAIHYLDTCGPLTLAKAQHALKIAQQTDSRQSLLNIWVTHSPKEVREHLREQFTATINEAKTATT